MKVTNRKAFHRYFIDQKLEAGLVLTGAEVKALRSGRVDLGESHIKILSGEAFLVNANIPRLSQTSSADYDPLRLRKLLMHKAQLESLIGKTSAAKYLLVPLSIYTKNNRFKVEVGLARAKKQFDKRAAIKKRDYNRALEQQLKGNQ